jgi:type IV pilus assembly protein PilM
VFRGDELVVLRNIHMGSNTLDKIIAENENIDEFVARGYKNSNFINILDKDYVQQQYNAIALEVRKVINFYRFNNRSSELEDIYFIGGGSRLKGFAPLIAEMNELNFRSSMEFLPDQVENGIDISAFCAIGVMFQ